MSEIDIVGYKVIDRYLRTSTEVRVHIMYYALECRVLPLHCDEAEWIDA